MPEPTPPFPHVAHRLDKPAPRPVIPLPLTAAPPFGWCVPCIIAHKMADLGYGPPVLVAQAVTLVNGTATCYAHIGVDVAQDNHGDSAPQPQP